MVKIDFVNLQEPAINDTNLNQMQLNIENAINAQVAGDTLPVGSIVPFGSNVIPENWLLCDGSAISRTEYALLFSIIGTTYGVGDGSTTFNIPNLPDTNYYNIIKSKSSAGVVATVIDSLTSTSQTDALSANQGRVMSTYSTTETVVGTWIDGKPLYRKVYNVSTTSAIDLSSLNYDFINIVSSMITISGYRRDPYYTGSSDYFRTLISGSKQLIIETSGSPTNWTTILEYTKTTD